MIINMINHPVSVVLLLMAVIISIVAHEIAHGYVALWNGDDTAKRAGRLSPNPLVHFNLFGFLMMVIVGFGFAKPVPVNPTKFRKIRRGIFTVAIAGVVVNIVLAFISVPLMLLFRLSIDLWFGMIVFHDFFMFMAIINISLFLFNLIPIFPLDGFRVVESFAKPRNRFVLWMQKYGMFVLLGVIIWSVFIGIIADATGIWWLNFIDPFHLYLFVLRDLILRGFTFFWGLMIPA